VKVEAHMQSATLRLDPADVVKQFSPRRREEMVVVRTKTGRHR